MAELDTALEFHLQASKNLDLKSTDSLLNSSRDLVSTAGFKVGNSWLAGSPKIGDSWLAGSPKVGDTWFVVGNELGYLAVEALDLIFDKVAEFKGNTD